MQLLQNHSNNNIQYLTMAIKAGIQFEFPCGTAFWILPGISGMIPGGIGGIEMFHNSRWDPPGIKLVSNWDPRWDWLDPASLFYLGIIAAKTSSQATGCGEWKGSGTYQWAQNDKFTNERQTAKAGGYHQGSHCFCQCCTDRNLNLYLSSKGFLSVGDKIQVLLMRWLLMAILVLYIEEDMKTKR